MKLTEQMIREAADGIDGIGPVEVKPYLPRPTRDGKLCVAVDVEDPALLMALGMSLAHLVAQAAEDDDLYDTGTDAIDDAIFHFGRPKIVRLGVGMVRAYWPSVPYDTLLDQM